MTSVPTSTTAKAVKISGQKLTKNEIASTPQVDSYDRTLEKLPTNKSKMLTSLVGIVNQLTDLELPSTDRVYEMIAALKSKGARVEEIGASRQNQLIHSVSVGEGPLKIAAVAGNHPDEPVGTLTLLKLTELLLTHAEFAPLLKEVTFEFVPMSNPDGRRDNEGWFLDWEKERSIAAYFENVHRDLPQDDVEFGLSKDASAKARPECTALARWFDQLGEIHHYVSLHSMFLGGGALYLVMTSDDEKRKALPYLSSESKRLGLPLHDKNRFGQKGFFYIAPGFQTAPTGEAMREFFAQSKNGVQPDFKLNTMQYVVAHNNCPLALVTELPIVYDRRFNDSMSAGYSRADEEIRMAAEIEAIAAADHQWLTGLPEEVLNSQAAKTMQARIQNERSVASAMTGDLDRYSGAETTVGNVLENNLQLAKRRIASLARKQELLKSLEATPEILVERARIGEKLHAEYQRIRIEFELEYPALNEQLALQAASILAGLLTMAS